MLFFSVRTVLKQQDQGDGDDGESGDKRSTRPTTARRRPPKVKDGAKELQSKDVAPAAKKTEGIIIDGQVDDVSYPAFAGLCCSVMFAMLLQSLICRNTLVLQCMPE